MALFSSALLQPISFQPLTRCLRARRRPRRLRNKARHAMQRYANASTRLTVNFRVEKVRTFSVQTPTRLAWSLRASSRNAGNFFDLVARDFGRTNRAQAAGPVSGSEQWRHGP